MDLCGGRPVTGVPTAFASWFSFVLFDDDGELIADDTILSLDKGSDRLEDLGSVAGREQGCFGRSAAADGRSPGCRLC